MSECYICGKKDISKNEVGLTKKLIGKNSKKFYCISCLAEQLDKIEEFKNEGCKLFE